MGRLHALHVLSSGLGVHRKIAYVKQLSHIQGIIICWTTLSICAIYTLGVSPRRFADKSQFQGAAYEPHAVILVPPTLFHRQESAIGLEMVNLRPLRVQ